MVSTSPSPRPSRGPNLVVQQLITCIHRVGETLGVGFSEKVYENALVHELAKTGLAVVQQRILPVIYDGASVGSIVADLVVAGAIVVELKSVRGLDEHHISQCANYLRATQLDVCLLVNFGVSPPEVKKLHRSV